MAWKKSKHWTVLAFSSVAFTPQLQAEELLWWVTNEVEPDVVPIYEGEFNPFPIRKKPEAPIIVQQKVEEKEVRSNSASARLLEKIREYLQTGEFKEPNIYTVEVKGYLEGYRGPSVLIADRWLVTGDHLAVPAQEKAFFKSLLEELEQIAPALYDSALPNLSAELTDGEGFKLTLKEITKDNIVLEDRQGEKYVISYLSGSW
ncbi:MAG: hypothetical protein OXR68_03735 [Alphaproteobacteria bacterium]|nr:hypothetical protein [Alphaproteobacteria bacterium]MDD9919718.1 hypothetical protein [Alphaproteobacteria bacterium]